MYVASLFALCLKILWLPLILNEKSTDKALVCLYEIYFICLYVSLEHKSSHKQHSYICSNSQQYIVWVKIIHFYFMPKIIRILISSSMKIFSEFPTINI